MSGGLRVGRTIDRYTIERHLGQGGMATVVRVRHTVLGTVHAMKVLHLSTPRLVDRFLREGRVQASIRHPNLVGVTDVITLDQGVALILEYVDGPTLSDLLRLFRPSVEELDALAEQVMQGVATAHAQGVVHRDLKPANVLVARSGDGLIAKVTDFGLARALVDGLGSAASLTQSGVPMGTPGYMAPEQFRSARDVDHRADIFSLGALLYELATGCVAFDGPNLMSVYEQIIAGRYLPVAQLCPDLPPRYGIAIHAALAAEPDKRPSNVEVFRALWHGGVQRRRVVWDREHLASVDRWIASRAAQLALTEPELEPELPALTTAGSSDERPTRMGLPPSLLPAPPPDPAPLRAARGGLALGLGAVALSFLAAPRLAVQGEGDRPVVAAAVATAPPRVATLEVVPAEAPPPALVTPEPAPEPEPPRTVRNHQPATVHVTGVDSAILVAANGTRLDASKPVPPGTYRVVIQDRDGKYVQVMRRTFKAGERVELVCQPLMAVCRER